MNPVTIFTVPRVKRPDNPPLSNSDYEAATDAAVMAARGLYADALLLFNNGRYARAAGIAILALEEVGKVKVLLRIFQATDEAARKAAWKEFLAHRAKSAEMIAAGPDYDEALVKKGFGEQADLLKQLGFYSNWLESGEWVWPEKVIEAKAAELAVTWAGVMIEQLESYEDAVKPKS